MKSLQWKIIVGETQLTGEACLIIINLSHIVLNYSSVRYQFHDKGEASVETQGKTTRYR